MLLLSTKLPQNLNEIAVYIDKSIRIITIPSQDIALDISRKLAQQNRRWSVISGENGYTFIAENLAPNHGFSEINYHLILERKNP
jgi:hypothetical protein